MRRKVDWVDAQRCRTRRTDHGWVESWSRGQKVSLLLALAQVEFRPSWAPPISMPILLPSTARLPSVLRRIALSSKTSDSGNGVLSNRNTGQTTTALKLPQPPMGRKGLKLSFPARTGRNLANTQSIDTI